MAIARTDNPALRAPVFSRIKDEDLKKLTPRQREIYICRLETDPPRSYNDLAERMGLKSTYVAGAWHKIIKRIGYNPIGDIVQKGRRPKKEDQALSDLAAIAPQTMAELMQSKIKLCLDHMNPAKVKAARADQLAKSIADLVKSRALILGEPTQILRVKERRHLNDLIPALLKEAEHRGFKIDGGALRKELSEPIDPTAIDAEFRADA